MKLEEKSGFSDRKIVILRNPSPEELTMAKQRNREEDILCIYRVIVKPEEVS
jgi:hypothetical protein